MVAAVAIPEAHVKQRGQNALRVGRPRRNLVAVVFYGYNGRVLRLGDQDGAPDRSPGGVDHDDATPSGDLGLRIARRD